MATYGDGGLERQNQFTEEIRKFLEEATDDNEEFIFPEKIAKLKQEGRRRLLVDMADIRRHDEKLEKAVRMAPTEYIGAFEEALTDAIKNEDPTYFKDGEGAHVGFEGQFGFHRVTPRELLSPFLGKLVQVEGIVTKCSVVRPKLVRSVHYKPGTDQLTSKDYRDITSFNGAPTPASIPTQDEDGQPMQIEYGKCVYKDHQSLVIQEMPESAPPGQLPRSVEVVVEEDLVDTAKPGDRVQLVGVYRPVPTAAGSTSGVYRTLLVGNMVRTIGGRVNAPNITEKDVQLMKQIVRRDDALAYMGSALAPSICGHQNVKEAILLLLAGGVEKTLKNKTHLRGDINMLMVGDPSVAKSQLLRMVMNISPLSVSTTGRGSSGVGLTAAVTTDAETGDRQLEAGAMVLADRGIVCIDEFDKMSDLDRVAIHETMEQQTVTIAKAGIHTTLNARCSVVAAANPVYGTYDTNRTMMENVGLPDSLLSRFDLLFILLDKMDPELDARIGEHVLRMHRFRGKGVGGAAVAAVEDDEEDGEEPSYATYDALLHGARRGAPLLSTAFLRKMISWAKERHTPQLTEEASEIIANMYTELRAQGASTSLPITARTLETMVRLATAHARLMLRKKVTERDATIATELLQRAIGGEEAAKNQRDDDRAAKRRKTEAREGGAAAQQQADAAGGDLDQADAEDHLVLPEAAAGADALEAAQQQVAGIGEGQMDALRLVVTNHFMALQEDNSEETTVGAILAAVGAALPAAGTTRETLLAYLRTIEAQNSIFLVGADEAATAEEVDAIQVHII